LSVHTSRISAVSPTWGGLPGSDGVDILRSTRCATAVCGGWAGLEPMVACVCSVQCAVDGDFERCYEYVLLPQSGNQELQRSNGWDAR
jgi:hypothetical protein